MDDNFQSFDAPTGPEPGGRRGRLPFQLNLQTVATGVLIVALVAILWIFFGPQPTPEAPPDLATATPLTQPTPGPGTGTVAAVPLASPIAGTALAPAGSPVAMASPGALGTPAAALGATSGALGTGVAGQSAGTPAAPGALAVGAFVRVGGTESLGIRLRYGAGGDFATIRILMDGDVLKVLGGPESAEGEQWWRVQDANGHVGWAAGTYLQPTTAPAGWAPPAASPTFDGSASLSGPTAEATP